LTNKRAPKPKPVEQKIQIVNYFSKYRLMVVSRIKFVIVIKNRAQ